MADPNSYDRRTFLARGAKAAAGATILGGGSSLLAACGTSSTGGGGPSGLPTTGGVSSATPKSGGSLTMAVESEVNGFNPRTGRFDPGGIIYARSVFDPLAAYASDGSVRPYLAQSITHNSDYTQWTITLRPNVVFHDGTPCDAAAVKLNLDGLAAAPLTGPALTNMAGTQVTGPLTVVVSTKEPWVAFPAYLTGQLGFVAAPSMLNSPGGGTDHPVGTGPFVFKEWVPNDHFTATKNPHYWRSGLPYLDQITYHPLPDIQGRDNSLNSGTIDLLHSSDTDTIVAFRNDNSVQLITDAANHVGEPDNDFIMLNTLAPPLDDVRVRTALAYATDKQTIINTSYNGLTQPSNGPFPPGTPWFADTGYPQYNPSKARDLIQQVQREKGSISFELGTTNTPKQLQIVQLIQSMWQAVGVQTTIAQVEQTQFILNALIGKYHAYTWRQFAGPDPDVNYVWWSIPDAAPIGQSALNFARNKDQQVQQALDTGRTQSDQATRNSAYQTIGKRFGADVPYLWIQRTLWAVAAKNKVMNFNGGTLPDGSQVLPMTGGIIWTTFTWLNT